MDDAILDRAEIEPLLTALRASGGETQEAVREALARLPIAPEELRSLGIAPPLRPPVPGREPSGFAPAGPEAGPAVPGPAASIRIDEDRAPAAVTRWFAQAVSDLPDSGLGGRIVAWVAAYAGVFRPDLQGLFAEYRRAALAECAAADRRPGRWLLESPGSSRLLREQIAWTVSRGGLPGLVPGLAGPLEAADETERTIAALLVAEAADALPSADPPLGLRFLLGDAALAGIVPAGPGDVRRPLAQVLLPSQPVPVPPPVPAPAREPEPGAVLPPPPASPEKALSVPRWSLVLAAAVGVLAAAKWLFGWFVTATEADAPGLDDVQCTVFAPPAAAPGSSILVQVFAHVPEEADDARAIATELDVAARRRAYRSLDAPVPVGARLDVELRMPGLEVDEPVASLVWRRRTEAVQFGVRVPAAARIGSVVGTVSIGRDGLPLGHVKFTLAIGAPGVAPDAEPQGVDARRYRLAFVSYASHDRDEVLRRVQMLPVAGLRYFQDVLDLEPGELWSARLEQAIRDADVFLLFWSSRAKQSEWVRREVDFALACKRDELSPPEIRPVIIEGPPVVPPWDDLAHLHFNDRVLYFMSRPR